jgi:hypothetical protein
MSNSKVLFTMNDECCVIHDSARKWRPKHSILNLVIVFRCKCGWIMSLSTLFLNESKQPSSLAFCCIGAHAGRMMKQTELTIHCSKPQILLVTILLFLTILHAAATSSRRRGGTPKSARIAKLINQLDAASPQPPITPCFLDVSYSTSSARRLFLWWVL